MEKCNNLEEVRANIDRIDKQIIGLLAERRYYVKQAAQFKKTADDVKAPARVEAVINKVRTLAGVNAIDPDFVERLYRLMIDYFINYEMKEHQSGSEVQQKQQG